MKRVLSWVLSTAAVLLSLQGCDPFYIIDWAPVNVYLKVNDAVGNDLLDPGNPENMIEGTSITFRGETYYASRERYDASISGGGVATRAYLAILSGLNLVKETDGFSLVFGEIDGAEDMDEDLVLSWPDGTTDTIHYRCSNHRYGRNPRCKRTWKLNGEKAPSCVFTFVK